MTPQDLLSLNTAVAKTLAAFEEGGTTIIIEGCVRCGDLAPRMLEAEQGRIDGHICHRCSRPTDHTVYDGGAAEKAIKKLEALIEKIVSTSRQRRL